MSPNENFPNGSNDKTLETIAKNVSIFFSRSANRNDVVFVVVWKGGAFYGKRHLEIAATDFFLEVYQRVE